MFSVRISSLGAVGGLTLTEALEVAANAKRAGYMALIRRATTEKRKRDSQGRFVSQRKASDDSESIPNENGGPY